MIYLILVTQVSHLSFHTVLTVFTNTSNLIPFGHLGAPAGSAVGAWPSFGPRVGQDAAESPTAVGSTPDALQHVTWDAVLVVCHLSLRPPAPQAEVEDGGHLTASPCPRGEGASEEGVEGLDGNMENAAFVTLTVL